MCKRNSPDKNEASVRKTPQIKNKLKKVASKGCVRETPQIKIKQTWDM